MGLSPERASPQAAGAGSDPDALPEPGLVASCRIPGTCWVPGRFVNVGDYRVPAGLSHQLWAFSLTLGFSLGVIMSGKRVYYFGDNQADGNGTMKNLLGGKGANLAEMVSLGVPVPPGFTITTEQCIEYQKTRQLSDELKAEVKEALAKVEAVMGKKFADPADPLLFSVRSGARVSMPGMMDTVLNLGLNDETMKGLIAKTGNERFAYDSYRRLVQMYGDVVMGVKPGDREEKIPSRTPSGERQSRRRPASSWTPTLTSVDRAEGNGRHLQGGSWPRSPAKAFPDDPYGAALGRHRGRVQELERRPGHQYRRINGIPNDWGTAVNVQTMVFGNMGDDSATGVAFTRDPSTGENYFYGEYLINAQGEDVVAGIRTPSRST